MSKNSKFETKLEKALQNYQETIDLLDYLLKEKRNAQEIVLLVCSRLDSLANLLKKDKTGQKSFFIQFLLKFSGQKTFFNKISVGDLYSYIYYYADITEGVLIEKPGRIQKFGTHSEDFLLFVEKSTVAITDKAVSQIAFRIAKILEKNYRVKPGQLLSKKYTASKSEIRTIILHEFKNPPPDIIEKSIEHLLDKFKICSIFYDKYRCGVIHGFKISLNEKEFFSESKPFHGIFNYMFGEIFNIEFPGIYLRELLSKSMNTLSNYLKSNKKLPIDLFYEIYTREEIFDGDVFKYLDDDSVEEFEDIKWQIKR